MELVISVVVGVLLVEAYAWLPKISEWLIERAVRRLPVETQERCREEWKADSHSLPNSGVKLLHALSLSCAANQINIDILEAKFDEYELSDVPRPPLITLTDIGFGYCKLVPNLPRKRFTMDFVAFDPEITELRVVVEGTWFADIEAAFGSTAGADIRATRLEGVPRDVPLFDENGTVRSTLRDLFAEFSQQMWTGKLLLNHHAKKIFNEPTFFRSQLPRVPFIKVREISATLALNPKLYQNVGREVTSCDKRDQGTL